MVLASIPLYFAARSGNITVIVGLIVLFVIGNLLALLAPKG
jgi:predicted MFS family arabinose efflux permease